MSKSILARRIAEVMVQHARPMSIQEIGSEIPEKPLSTIRGRIYRELHEQCKRISRGVYMFLSMDEAGAAIVVEGNGRDLSAFESCSIDAIVTDHPWDCESNVGTNRRFDSGYEDTTFRYQLEDFKEKARVLKNGGFLVELLPAENEKNFKYLYEIKMMAEQCGLQYYSLIRWKKGIRVFNTGRCSKNTETVMFFTKGKARSLRPDKQRGGLMSGTTYMLPTEFDYQPASPQHRIHQAEKPVELYEAILEAITLPGEVVIDQFAGSGNLGRAAMRKGRIAVLFEILKENVVKIRDNLSIPELQLF